MLSDLGREPLHMRPRRQLRACFVAPLASSGAVMLRHAQEIWGDVVKSSESLGQVSGDSGEIELFGSGTLKSQVEAFPFRHLFEILLV